MFEHIRGKKLSHKKLVTLPLAERILQLISIFVIVFVVAFDVSPLLHYCDCLQTCTSCKSRPLCFFRTTVSHNPIASDSWDKAIQGTSQLANIYYIVLYALMRITLRPVRRGWTRTALADVWWGGSSLLNGHIGDIALVCWSLAL